MSPESRSQAIAAATILICAGLVIYFLPTLVLWIGSYSRRACGRCRRGAAARLLR